MNDNGFRIKISTTQNTDGYSLNLSEGTNRIWSRHTRTRGNATNYRWASQLTQNEIHSGSIEFVSATTTRNTQIEEMHVDFIQKFGAPLSIQEGGRFYIEVSNNFSGISVLFISLSGYYA
jgi:hypothetical protein